MWKKTIFILTYDENDGYFDHVPPFCGSGPQAARNRQNVTWRGRECGICATGDGHLSGPIGMGFRVPFVVASPWSRGGYVNSQVFDHTSILRLLERILSRKFRREIREVNISPWRRAVCGDLSSIFLPFREKKKLHLYLSRPAKKVFEYVHNAQFKKMPSGFRKLAAADVTEFRKNRFSAGWMPRQEPGTRPSTALPYQLYASGALSPAEKTLAL